MHRINNNNISWLIMFTNNSRSMPMSANESIRGFILASFGTPSISPKI